ncbi:MAG: hypothetical protein KA214_04600 [Neisseriaceae bacterium]|nr:hypothetical protein [Neisseriaceae bacterium]
MKQMMPVKEAGATLRPAPLLRLERYLLGLAGLWLMLAMVGPHIPQYADYHGFADQSHWLGMSHWGDVWSNVPITCVGIVGIWLGRQGDLLRRWPVLGAQQQLFFYGLVLTGVGSFVYHLEPNDQTLWLDRLGMCVAFAGMLGVALTHRCSDRAGEVVAYAALIAGPVSLWLWQYSGSLWVWGLYQGGGMVLIMGLAMLPAVSTRHRISLAAVMACYGVAKLCELGDHQLFALTQGWVSGHTLKHLWSAAAGLPLVWALRRQRRG